MTRSNFEKVLFTYRGVLSAVSVLLIAYFVLFAGLAVPGVAMFLTWNPDTQLRVMNTLGPAYTDSLQPDDEIVAIDGRQVQRGGLVFPLPLQETYTLTLQRDAATVDVVVPAGASQFFDVWRLSLATLAFLIWLLGYLTARYARRGEGTPLVVGFAFQLIAAGIVSPGPGQLGAPGAWLVEGVLVNYFPAIMLYLSFLPRFGPPTRWTRLLLATAIGLSTLLALLSLWERLVLFPNRSLAGVLGADSTLLLALWTGVALIAAGIILIGRLLRTARHSYARQQLTLLSTFLLLAIVPLLGFVLAPVFAARYAPLPLAYSFLLFAPAGYFFVLHRQGHLVLDAVFSNVIVVGVLVLALTMIYSTGSYLFATLFGMSLNSINQALLMVTLLGVALVAQRPVQAYVDLLVYGRQPPVDEAIQAARMQLAAQPEPAAVDDVLLRLAPLFQIDNTAVLVPQRRAGAGEMYRHLAGSAAPLTVQMRPGWRQMCLRTRNPEMLAGLPDWVALLLPLIARDEMVGLLLLSAPRQGYFNGRQQRWLADIADMLAFSLLVISLVAEMDTSIRDVMQQQERTRLQFATNLHNEPLQELMGLILNVQIGQVTRAEETLPALKEVKTQLRRLLQGLRPINPVDRVPQIVQRARDVFQRQQRDVVVDMQLDIAETAAITAEEKQILYYILTEALNNVARHAQATRVALEVCHTEAELTLTVTDNGCGPGAAGLPAAELLRRNHEGVVMMHRWASIGGGQLTLGKGETGGTRVMLRMPAGRVAAMDAGS